MSPVPSLPSVSCAHGAAPPCVLPEELWAHIIDHTDAAQYLTNQRVNRAWNAVSRTTGRVQAQLRTLGCAALDGVDTGAPYDYFLRVMAVTRSVARPLPDPMRVADVLHAARGCVVAGEHVYAMRDARKHKESWSIVTAAMRDATQTSAGALLEAHGRALQDLGWDEANLARYRAEEDSRARRHPLPWPEVAAPACVLPLALMRSTSGYLYADRRGFLDLHYGSLFAYSHDARFQAGFGRRPNDAEAHLYVCDAQVQGGKPKALPMPQAVASLSFSANGSKLLVRLATGVSVLDAPKGFARLFATETFAPVVEAALSQDGKLLAVVCQNPYPNRVVSIWDVDRQRQMGRYSDFYALFPSDPGACQVSFDAFNETLALPNGMLGVTLLNVAHPHEVTPLPVRLFARGATAAAFLPVHYLLATGDFEGTLVFWSLQGGTPRRLAAAPTPFASAWPAVRRAIRSIEFSASGGQVLVTDTQHRSWHFDLLKSCEPYQALPPLMP